MKLGPLKSLCPCCVCMSPLQPLSIHLLWFTIKLGLEPTRYIEHLKLYMTRKLVTSNRIPIWCQWLYLALCVSGIYVVWKSLYFAIFTQGGRDYTAYYVMGISDSIATSGHLRTSVQANYIPIRSSLLQC